MSQHVFNYDWFSGNIPIFQRYIGELRDTPCAILEIGCHEGRSTTWLLEHVATHPKSSITSLDLHLQPNFQDNVKASGGEGRVHLRLGMSRNLLRKLPLNHFDFIYIDGSHSTLDVLEDAVLSFRLAKPGAVIAFDDYLWDDPEFNQHGTPKAAVDVFLTVYRKKILVLEHGYQVWVRKIAD